MLRWWYELVWAEFQSAQVFFYSSFSLLSTSLLQFAAARLRRRGLVCERAANKTGQRRAGIVPRETARAAAIIDWIMARSSTYIQLRRRQQNLDCLGWCEDRNRARLLRADFDW